jgi:hypothetical protein
MGGETRGGKTVANKKDRTDRTSRPRLDLAGILFNPHWPSLRADKDRAAEPEANVSLRPRAGRRDSLERPRNVICGGMYRACSTWQYAVVAHLVEHYLGGERLGYLSGERYRALEQSPAGTGMNATAAQPPWRAFKSHEGDRSFARAMADGRALAVYAYRDVRDVVFSLMHKRGMTFEQLLRRGMIHQILANDRFWTAQPGVLVQRYEDLVSDPAAGVIQVADHLGVRLDEDDAARIARAYSRESNVARTAVLKWTLEQAGVNLTNSVNAQICDATTLLHWNHIRPSSSRCWRALATAPQKELLDRLCGRWLEARGYAVEADSPRILKSTLGERARCEIDLLAARANYLARCSSQRFPRTSRLVKRTLGMHIEALSGATAWADGLPAQHPVAAPASAAPAPPLATWGRRG